LIFTWYLYKAAGYAAGLSFLKAGANALPPVDRLRGITGSPTVNYMIGFTAPLLNLSGAVALIFLRRAASWLFAAALLVGVGLSSLAIAQWLHGGVRGSILAVNAFINCCIGAGVLWYSWRLRKAGRLY